MNRIWLLLLIIVFLFESLSGLSAPARKNADASATDWRNFANGRIIPDEDYCDQPRIVVTRDGTWVCILTTGPANEGAQGQHVVATSSADKGKTWSPLVNVEPPTGPKSAYALALVTPSDRIYAFYCYNGDNITTLPDGTPIRDDMQGWFCYRFSDDKGKSWSERQRLPMRLTAGDRNNNWQGKLQMFWAIGTPSVQNNSVVFGFTKLGRYILQEGEGWFYRSDNVLTEKDPRKLDWQLLPEGDNGVRAPEFGSVQEEFDVVHLEGNDLFTVYRTTTGHACSSYSRDGGRTWEKPDALRYTPGGRIMKQPRACTKIWKTRDGHYLLWYHNNGIKTYNNGPGAGSRNIAWLTSGTLKDGRLSWAQPEVCAYVDGELEGCSYPDLVEDSGEFYLVATQKTEARVMPVNRELLRDLFNQPKSSSLVTNGLVLSLSGQECAPGAEGRLPELPPLGPITRERSPGLHGRGGFAIEVKVRLENLSHGQVLVDGRDGSGKGFALTTGSGGVVRLEMSDGWRAAFWDCDPGLLEPGRDHHVVAIVDGGPKLITFVVDGALCDGGKERLFGFGRFDAAFRDANGSRKLKIAPKLNGKISAFKVYNRALLTSEAVANLNATK